MSFGKFNFIKLGSAMSVVDREAEEKWLVVECTHETARHRYIFMHGPGRHYIFCGADHPGCPALSERTCSHPGRRCEYHPSVDDHSLHKNIPVTSSFVRTLNN